MHETNQPGPETTTELRLVRQLEYLGSTGFLPLDMSPIVQLAAERADADQVADVLDQIASYAAFMNAGTVHPISALYLATTLVESGQVASTDVANASRLAGKVPDLVALVLLATGDTDYMGNPETWAQRVVGGLISQMSNASEDGGGSAVRLQIATKSWKPGSSAALLVEAVQRVIEAVREGQLDPGLSPSWTDAVADDLIDTFTSDLDEKDGF